MNAIGGNGRKFKWWMGLIIAAGVLAIAAFIASVVACCCCCGSKMAPVRIADESEVEEDPSDDEEECVVEAMKPVEQSVTVRWEDLE